MGGDDYVFLRAARAFASKQDSAKLEVIPKSGHICNIESPDAFNRLAIEFLSKQDGVLGRTQKSNEENHSPLESPYPVG